MNLSIPLGLVFIACSNMSSAQHSSYSNPRNKKITTIFADAICIGPKGNYNTTVYSDPLTTLFHQTFSYQADSIYYYISTPDSCDASGKKLSTMETFVAQSHDFIRLALDPAFLFIHTPLEKVMGDTVYMEGKTSIGVTLIFKATKNNRQPISHELHIPDNNSLLVVRWKYSDWIPMGEFMIPFKIEIKEGEKRFSFRYTEININSKKFFMPQSPCSKSTK